ncbi:MAG: transposase [Candidatus Edwardsbacteria bacterium]|jgi:REP element-mobilizing transposase RayT|nr:transposase [Candidatus Edwardsbacteria bacterium]
MHRERRTVRLPGYDYASQGAYFVTVCTRDRECALGKIASGILSLSRFGEIARSCWEGLPRHYSGIELGAFIVMPNHVHGIIVITGDITVKRNNDTVGAGLKPAPTVVKRHALPEIIRAFKTFSARGINLARDTPGRPFWQRNYYEHVIRNGEEYDRIRQYILENPSNWPRDDENPGRIG